MSTLSQAAQSNFKALVVIVLGAALLPSGCLSAVGTRYALRSHEEATTLSPANLKTMDELPRFVRVQGKVESRSVSTTSDDNLVFRLAEYPALIFVAGDARDAEHSRVLLAGSTFDGRLYAAADYSSLAVNQFAQRMGMKSALVVAVGETPGSQRWQYKLAFGIAAGIVALALALLAWLYSRRSTFTGGATR